MGSGSDLSSAGSTIQITRRTTYWVDILRAYRIYIDGQYVGKVRNGATAEFSVDPGLHEVFLRIDWCASPRAWVQSAPGGTAKLTCQGRANPFAAIGAALFAWNQYVRLFAVPDPR